MLSIWKNLWHLFLVCVTNQVCGKEDLFLAHHHAIWISQKTHPDTPDTPGPCYLRILLRPPWNIALSHVDVCKEPPPKTLSHPTHNQPKNRQLTDTEALIPQSNITQHHIPILITSPLLQSNWFLWSWLIFQHKNQHCQHRKFCARNPWQDDCTHSKHEWRKNVEKSLNGAFQLLKPPTTQPHPF